MHLLSYLMLLYVSKFIMNILMPFFARINMRMVPGFIECLWLIPSWLVISCYHGQVNQRNQIFVGIFFLGNILNNFVNILVVCNLQLFHSLYNFCIDSDLGAFFDINIKIFIKKESSPLLSHMESITAPISSVF